MRFADPQGKEEFQLVEIGLIQVAGKWASFTARVRSGTEERTALVVVDGGNPLASQATLRVELEGGRRWELPLGEGEYKVSVSK